MEIPQALREAMEKQLSGMQPVHLMDDAQAISLKYRTKGGKGERLLTKDNEAIAYAAARMPATFGAVSAALEQALLLSEFRAETLLDAGAGTGAASWAADNMFELNSIICLEREEAMINAGKAMMENGSPVLCDAKWLKRDLVMDEIDERAELVIASYVFNEMTKQGRLIAAQKLWAAAEQMLLLVEPGTPAAFSNLMEVRRFLLAQGAHITAPCPHEKDCPKTGADWCHFSCRINRTRLHKQLKGGEAPFEDEKFIYMAFTRLKPSGSTARVLRHPQVRSGHIMLDVCTDVGVRDIRLSKKDGEKYKQARKAKSGDRID